MHYEIDGTEVLRVEEIVTATQTATVRTGVARTRALSATITGSEILVEHRRPDLSDDDSGEWDGRLEPVDLTAGIAVDGQDAGTVNLTAGKGSFLFEAEPGTYEVTIAAEGVTPATLTVEVPAP